MKFQYFRHIACALLCIMLVLSCSNDAMQYKKGEQKLVLGEYYEASIYFKRAYSATPNKQRALRAERAYIMGECYRHINNPAKAVAAYQNAIRNWERVMKDESKAQEVNSLDAKAKAKAKAQEAKEKAREKARAAKERAKEKAARAKAKAKEAKERAKAKERARKLKAKGIEVDESKEPKAESPESRDQSPETTTESKEQKAKSKESKAESKRKEKKEEEFQSQLNDSIMHLYHRAYFYLGQQQLKLGGYKYALESFQKFLSLENNCERKELGLIELAHAGVLSCELGPQWKAHPNDYIIKKEALFNSRRSDYSPMFVGDDGDKLLITSTRTDSKGDDLNSVTGVKSADMFLAKKDEAKKWKQPEIVESEINSENDEGASCLSADGKTMYFTRCIGDSEYPRKAEIWQSPRSDATWSKPTKVEIIKDTISSFAHPAASPDGKWLYFVSDMPGGMGGYDIWRAELISGGGFAGLENLGRPINTAGDEMFPSFRPNGDLYFSSDGHPGMGGLDILLAHYDSITGWKVTNQQAPLNSPMDDFGMTFEGVHNRGFFSSSRNDGKGWEHIYSFEVPEILQTVTGWVYEKDGYELPEGLVYMVGDDGTNEKVSVKGDGSFTKVLKPGVRYLFLGTCKGYLNVRNQLRLPENMTESHDYTLQFPLPPLSIPVLIDNIFYEFGKATLTESSTEALQKLVTMMEENPHITIELGAHCDYRGNDQFNQTLSQRRAESVVSYMRNHGVKADRMTAKGYGERSPKIVKKKLAEKYDFLHEGDTLTEAFIKKLPEKDQEVCNALNRRTEFRVLRTTYGLTLSR